MAADTVTPVPGSDERDDTRRPSLAPFYELGRVLGRGGMATVYLAVESKHGRQVAVKLLDRHAVDAEGAERFLFEIHLTARLSHPHIVPLLDSGKVEEQPYYVMPLVEGGTLRLRIDRGPLDATEALRLAGEVADALAYAHAQGVLHRDIKPENIMVSGRRAVVTDFGVARALLAASESHADLLDDLTSPGTPAYVSPEQATGDQAADERSDVYSLGAVLFEMLTGEAAYVGATAQATIAQRFVGPPPSPRERRGDVHVAVDALVRRSMAFEPSERYASAAELGDALERVAHAVRVGRAAAEVAHAMPSVAVLPIVNHSGDADDDYLASGLTDEVLTSLSRDGRIRVAGRGSSLLLSGTTVDVREISDRLGVRAVLTGSMRRAGSRLRVAAQLISGADGFQLWAGRFDRTMDDLFAVQDEIADHIVRALQQTMLGAPLEDKAGQATIGSLAAGQPALAHPDAYTAYLRGRHLLHSRTRENMFAAREWFATAIATDPTFAAAYAARAETLTLLGVYGETEPAAAFESARESAQNALQLDLRCAAAHAALGVVEAGYDRAWTAAEQSFVKSLAIAPSASASQWLCSMVLLPQRRFEDAFVSVRQALRLDPLSLSARATLTVALLYARRYDEAQVAAAELLALDPRFALAHLFLSQVLLATGDLAGGVAAAQRARELSGDSNETIAMAAFALGAHGEHAAAASLSEQLEARSGEHYVAASHRALARLGVGDTDAALRLLEQAADERVPDMVWVGVRPVWDCLRESSRFQRLVQRVTGTS